MIFGIGTDIADCARVGAIYAKHGHHFVRNILTPAELERMAELKDPKEFIAGRWAAKEAFSKALGTGMCAECAFVEIEVLSDERGKPFVKLYAATAETAERLGIARIHVSISHERELATAFVVLETEDGGTAPAGQGVQP
ncbi:MAG: holo-ACP synthase [Lentisphaeria bacterium]|jgi:holo-[acyl-carrier protein] synthase|nr:holo-ACP synthase [Lentisphaeria bacterium]